MKRYFTLLLCLFIVTNSAFSFSFFKKKEEPEKGQVEKSGYKGELPDLNRLFNTADSLPDEVLPPHSADTKADEKSFQKIPDDNYKYVEIIMKKNSPSDFILDLREVVTLLEKIKKTVDDNGSQQFFNAQVATLIYNINYLQETYANKDEYKFMGRESMIRIGEDARELAILSTRKSLYKQYIPSSEETYSRENIKMKLDNLSKDINDLLFLLKNTEAMYN